ncbi:MAG: hypothetical protein ABIJ59_16390 [Pseudomonadota bacterium]
MTDNIEKSPHEIVEMSPYDILVDEELRPRAETHESIIYEYAETLEEGNVLPPIDIYSDGEVCLLADGYYRLEAYKLAGFDNIPAIVHQGGQVEALIHALGSNTDHGVRRTNADKRKAVTIILTHPDFQGLSDNQIAGICKVSQPFVGTVRKKLTYSGYKFGTTRVCSDGRIMDVSNIGETVPAPVEPEASEVGDNNNEVTEPSDPEDLELAEDQDQDPEDNVDTGPGDNNPDDVANPPESASGDDDQDLDIDLEDDPGADGTDESETDADETDDPETTETESEDDPDPDADEDDLEDVVDTDTEDDASGDDNTDAEAQDLNQNDSGDEGNDLDSAETTEPGAGEDELETELGDETDNDQTDETTESDNEIETREEDTGDNGQGNSELDGFDSDTLKLMIAEYKDTTKIQEEELKAKDDQIVELKQKVEELEEENLYLTEQLNAHASAGSEAFASLNLDSMDEEDSHSLAYQ